MRQHSHHKIVVFTIEEMFPKPRPLVLILKRISLSYTLYLVQIIKCYHAISLNKLHSISNIFT